MIGRQLSHFRITDQIGAGGMGVVYRAVDLRLQRTVAIKVLPPDFGRDTERKQRFFREAQAASALNHPGIVTVHEVDTAEGVDFIAMEYVEGRSLDQVIAGQGLPLQQALTYAIQIGDALARAHTSGIVHRDLKPRNVIVTPEDRVKVLDFGIAKRFGPGLTDPDLPTQDVAPETREGVVVGTPQYMSPEQAQGKKVDARSDLFSFGALLYEMLTGRSPFGGQSVAELMVSILRDTPRPLRALRPDLPEEIERIVAKALEKDLEYRYQHMQDLLADLKKLRRDSGISEATTLLAPRPALRKPVLVRAIGIAATTVLLLGAAFWLTRARRAPPPPSQFHLVSTFPGSHRAPSFSPDGKMFAFVDDVRGVPQVWVKYVDQGDPVQITAGETAAGRPRWSPKGDQIVFEWSKRGIWSVPPLGGPARQILEEGSCPSFFPDGERLVFDRGPELWTARADGSEARRLEGVPINFFSFMIKRCAAVSPDGRRVAYYQPERGPSGDLWIVSAAGGEPRRLTSDSAEAGTPVWAPDGRFIVFSSARRGSRTLWRIPVDGGDPEPVTTGAGEDGEPDISSDGKRLLYSNARNSHAVILLDPGSGSERVVVERRSHLNGPKFSPDGNRIAFFTTTDQLEQIFTVGVDGQDLRQITRGEKEANVMPRWSADGSFLYFYQQVPTPSFRKVAAAGGPSSTVIDGWRWELQNGSSVDPLGRLVAYSLYERDQIRSARVRDLATGRERDLGRALDDPQWSRDGRLVAGADPDGNVAVCPADGGDCEILGKGIAPCWSGDGRRIYFQRPGRPLDDPNLRSVEAWVMNRDGSHPRRIGVLEPQLTLSMPFDVSVRGQIVWPQFRRGKRELWLAELER